MRKVYLLMMLILPLIGMAQNGGQANENSALRLDFLNYSNGVYKVNIRNKQTCTVPVRVQWLGKDTAINVDGGNTKTIELPGSLTDGKIKAQTTTVCSINENTNGNGWVELMLFGDVLPLKYKDFSIKRDGNILYVSITPLETTNVKVLNVQISMDGRSFRTVSVINRDELTINQRFTKTIYLK